MKKKQFSRRDLLRLGLATGAGAAFAGVASDGGRHPVASSPLTGNRGNRAKGPAASGVERTHLFPPPLFLASSRGVSGSAIMADLMRQIPAPRVRRGRL